MKDPYSRIYHRLSDEYPDIFDNPAALGTYVQMLVMAEQAFPNKPRLPVADESVVLLTKAGLVDVSGSRYTIKGLDKERLARSKQASNAAASRWDKVADAGALRSHPDNGRVKDADPMPRRDKQETNKDEDEEDAGQVYYRLQAGRVSPKALSWVDKMEAEYGRRELISAMGHVASTEGVGQDFLSKVQGRAALEASKAAKAREEAQKDRAIKEQEAHRARVENATPEELAKIEQNKARIRAMVSGIASGSDDGQAGTGGPSTAERHTGDGETAGGD